jgi:hypothetical protein
VTDAIYARDGDVWTPTRWAGSPWSPDAQHGGPVAGLFARAAEEAAQGAELQLARLTVDLFRPVPRQPLRLAQRWVRRGRKLALADFELHHGEEAVARASALYFAPRPALASGWRDASPPPPPLARGEPLEFMPAALREQWPPGFHLSVQARAVRDERGAAIWLTTPLDLVAGEPTSPQVRFAALSDLTFAMGMRLGFLRGPVDARALQTRFINADVTLYRERAPVGEWVAFRLATLADAAGVGLAEVEQFDATGRIGRSLQALVANG